MYSFDTSELGFYEWVEENGRSGLSGPEFGPSSIAAYDQVSERIASLEIEDAISFDWWEEDRGWYMVYDRAAKRAYFHYASR